MKKRLRILTIGHSYIVGPNRSIMEQIATSNEVDLTVLAPKTFHGDFGKLSLKLDSNLPYRLIGIPAHFTSSIHLFYYLNLYKAVPWHSFDLVHAWEEPYILAGYQIAKTAVKAKVPYIFRTAQSLPKTYPWPFRHFEKFCVNAASGWIAGGHLVHEALKSTGYPEENSEVLTLGVDTQLFRPDKTKGERLKQKLALNGPVIGFLGRLVASKGLDILMQALDQVKTKWNLLILGNGPYQKELEQWASDRGLSERLVIKAVSYEEVPAYLNVMDLLVAPSQTTPQWKEQFGRMIIEAFACKVPVIGSCSGEIPNVIKDAGIILPEKNVKLWADTISELLVNPKQLNALANAGFNRCHALYSANAVSKMYLDFYKRIVSQHKSNNVFEEKKYLAS